jgi:hypothetical protein
MSKSDTVSQSQPGGAPESAATEAEPSAALLPSEVLEQAAALIEPEGAWTQGEYGRDSQGFSVPNWDPRCVCRCASGAIWSAAGEQTPAYDSAARDQAHLYLRRSLGHGITIWNDDGRRTQPEVVAALRKAAELARSEGQ